MSDFFQTGAIATLHRLGPTDLPRLERELQEFAKETPIALVLPCHINELGTKALKLIVRELRSVPYLKQIVVGIDGATCARHGTRPGISSRQLPQKPTLLWNDGPRMQQLFQKLEDAELSAGPGGKGRNVWTCFGYVLASEQARMVAVHDCDILTYNRELLARLCYPVAHPALGFDFCKGYYARVTDQLNGRVMRLLVTPLLRALKSILGQHPYLVYMDTFRYPLAGEFSMDVDLVRRVRIPYDWALEVGMLAEVFRNSAPRAICQSELCENYDHKHQELSPRDPEKGLNKMAAGHREILLPPHGGRRHQAGRRIVRHAVERLHAPGGRHAAVLRRRRGVERPELSAPRGGERRGHVCAQHPHRHEGISGRSALDAADLQLEPGGIRLPAFPG